MRRALIAAAVVAVLAAADVASADPFPHVRFQNTRIGEALDLMLDRSPAFRAISHANPFFYVISGFRAGFLGTSDSPLWIGAIGLFLLNVVLWDMDPQAAVEVRAHRTWSQARIPTPMRNNPMIP